MTAAGFSTHTGTAAPLRRSDVDTDQIIPSDWLKRVERTGFGAGLLSAWREGPSRVPTTPAAWLRGVGGTAFGAGLFTEWREDPSFVLNQPERAGATVLVAGENFG